MTTKHAAAVIALEEFARWLDERATEAAAIRDAAEVMAAVGKLAGPDAARPEHFEGERQAFEVAAAHARTVIRELRHLRVVPDDGLDPITTEPDCVVGEDE